MKGQQVKLDKRIAFDELDVSRDEAGGENQDWVERFVVGASCVRLRGAEAVVSARLEGKQPTVITVRASSQTKAITPAWRARDARTGEVFNIHTSILSDNRAYYELTATSGVAV